MPGEGIRIGIDTGGTFTDFALVKDDVFHSTKILTTHQAPERAIMKGLYDLMEVTGYRPSDTELIIHGTTLATNAIIEHKGAKVAMLTTEGFRDVLETGTESRFDQYDLGLTKPEPLVPRQLRFTIAERLAADGHVLLPVNLSTIRQIAEELKRNEIESIAICFLHSFINPEHEECVADALRKHIPDIYISLSSQVAPEIREYERFSTTVANAYIQPLIDSYLKRLQEQLARTEFDCPLYMFASNGGLVEVDIARQFPVRLVESGPAGGAVFASHVARIHQEDRILSFDMGGTTAKICLIDNAEPQKATVFEMARVHRFKKGSGLPARIPVIEMVEIGAGGGSIARVDSLGRITVGPESAGSEPGPACYDLNGDNATVTDADLILGRLETEGFGDGSMQLDSEAARQSVQEYLAGPLQMDIPTAAYGVAEIVEEDMANAAREYATESGKTLTDRTLVAFGGAAPLHALSLAGKLGINRVIIPANAGVGSAIGFLLAPVAFELSRSCFVRLNHFQTGVLNNLFEEMSEYAHGVVSSGAPGRNRTEIWQAQMRYIGQGYSIPVELPVQRLGQDDARALQRAFDKAYTNLYKKLHDGVDVEIVGVSVSVSAYLVFVKAAETTGVSAAGLPDIDHTSTLFDAHAGGYREMNVYSRSVLRTGHQLTGPSLVRDKGTTVMVPDGCDVTVADDDSLIIEMRANQHG